MLLYCVCLDLLQFASLLTIYAVEQNVVAYCHAYIYGKRTKVGTLVQMITYYTSNCFSSLLTSNWEVSTHCSLNNFINFTQTTQNFVINSYIEAMETKLSFGKHTLRVFTGNFGQIVGKTLYGCLIFVFASICCISCHF